MEVTAVEVLKEILMVLRLINAGLLVLVVMAGVAGAVAVCKGTRKAIPNHYHCRQEDERSR